MLAEICFPFFDTRFLREDADEKRKPAPRWLYGEPPPPLGQVGRLGRVDKWIPPLPYARCLASDLVSLQPPAEVAGVQVAWRLLRVEALADQHGHARLSLWVEAAADWADHDLATVAETVAAQEVAVRHPDRRGLYERLAEAGDSLADLYARESARTAPAPRGDYQADWVVAARPFMILVNVRREFIESGAEAINIPLLDSTFPGTLNFLPWRSQEGDAALPVWYLDAPRGGDAWRQPAEAVEEVNARYEELFTCSLMREMAAKTEADDNFTIYLGNYCRRLAATLRRTKRHGVNLQAVLQLISDFDRSQLKPRESPEYTSALLDRVSQEVADASRSRSGEQTFIIRRLDMTINSSGQGSINIINLSQMITGTIQTTNTMIGDSQAAPELKEQLEALREPVIEASKKLPDAEAKALLRDYENFTEASLREQPPKEIVKAQGNQILNALNKIAEYSEPVGKIIRNIFRIVAIF